MHAVDGGKGGKIGETVRVLKESIFAYYYCQCISATTPLGLYRTLRRNLGCCIFPHLSHLTLLCDFIVHLLRASFHTGVSAASILNLELSIRMSP